MRMEADSNMNNESQQTRMLIESLSYIQKLQGKIVVIKYGGNAMINHELKQSVVQDIIFMKKLGVYPVVVHGGGPEITALLQKTGKNTEFVAGLRVTDAETAEIAQMVLVGKINPDLVHLLNAGGVKAIGLNGKDANLIMAKKHLAQVHKDDRTEEVDIGFVGDVEEINCDIIDVLLDNDVIPVIAPIGVDKEGCTYNINADYAAAAIAGALWAEHFILLTDVEGIYGNYQDKSTFIASLKMTEAQRMIRSGAIAGGMIPKVESCQYALEAGAVSAHIVDGRVPHSLLFDLFTDKNVGTELLKE